MQQPAFDPLRFLNLADELATDDADEAALRVAIGRAYYAVFLLARMQTSVEGRHQAHHRVRQELSPRSGRLAALLGTMSSYRDLADYDLQPANRQLRDWQRNWRNVRKNATEVLEELSRLPNLTTYETDERA